MIGRIVTQWEDIVGSDMAAKSMPGKLKYRSKKGSKKPEFALEIEVSSADATILSYRIDLILARLNQIFGEGVITAIRFIPQTANSQLPKTKKRKTPLSQEKKDYIHDIVEEVEDPEMQERLKNLGIAILQDDGTPL
jgi:hypothetical protein